MKKNLILKVFLLIFAFFIVIQLNNLVWAAETPGLTNKYLYNIKNRNSGKYLNVNYGTDADGTNVNQYTYDGSDEQKFTLDYMGDQTYKLYVFCSDTRVLDVYRPLQNNANVDIWLDNDLDAQVWKIENLGNGYYSIKLSYNTNLALTAYGTSNGGGSGKGPTSAGNVFVSTYTGAANQQWSFERTPALLSWDLVSTDKKLHISVDTKYLNYVSTATNIWNNIKSGLIQNSYDGLMMARISDYYEENTGVLGTTSASGTIKFNTYYLDNRPYDTVLNCVIHEIGHALRLHHYQDVSSVMNYFNNGVTTPNAIDIWNLNQAYLYY